MSYFAKPGSHLCDKHNTSDISISITTRKKDHVPFFLVFMLMLMLMLMLMSLVLFLLHKCEPGLRMIETLIACSSILKEIKDVFRINRLIAVS